MRILVCRPKYFGVEYVINPWMEGQIGRVDRERAERQWNGLFERVARVAAIEEVAPQVASPDMCFTANAGLVAGGRAVAARFRMPERAAEEPPFARWFTDAGFDLVALPDEDPFEGEGDALFQPGEPILWGGYGVRSALETHVALGQIFGVEVVSLRLVDPRFYHLDTCFAPLPDGRLLYYPAAFDEPSQRLIERRVEPSKRLAIDDADAMGFACNMLRVEDHVFLNSASPALVHALGAWGFEVHVQPVDEFLKAGGGVKCLSLILDQTPFARLEPPPPSSIRTAQVELKGHLMDSGGLSRALDVVTDSGASFRVTALSLAERKDQESRAELRVVAPSEDRLEGVLSALLGVGAQQKATGREARLESVTQEGVAPDGFYSTTIFPTEVRVAGEWIPVERQRMDAVVVVETKPKQSARCTLFRDLRRATASSAASRAFASAAPRPAMPASSAS